MHDGIEVSFCFSFFFFFGVKCTWCDEIVKRQIMYRKTQNLNLLRKFSFQGEKKKRKLNFVLLLNCCFFVTRLDDD